MDSYRKEDLEQLNFSDDYFALPNHSQAVERWVNNTSYAAKYYIGYEARHGYLLNFQESTAETDYTSPKKFFVDTINSQVKSRELFRDP